MRGDALRVAPNQCGAVDVLVFVAPLSENEADVIQKFGHTRTKRVVESWSSDRRTAEFSEIYERFSAEYAIDASTRL